MWTVYATSTRAAMTSSESASAAPSTFTTAGSGDPSTDERLMKVRNVRDLLQRQHQKVSATLAPTVLAGHTTGGESAQAEVAVYLHTLQSTLDLLLKREEDRLTAKPDPHLLRVQEQAVKLQEQQIALAKRDHVHMSRGHLMVWGAVAATSFVGNILLAAASLLHLALDSTSHPSLPEMVRPTAVQQGQP